MAAALKTVGISSVLTTSSSSAVSTLPLAQQSDTIRVVAQTAGMHVAIGTNPTATAEDFFVTTTDTETLSIGPVTNQKVVGFTTGTTTTLDFPEGTGCPFGVGDYVSLTTIETAAFNFSHKPILSINHSSDPNGFYATRIVVDHNSTAVTAGFNAGLNADLGRSFKVSVLGAGAGKAYIQQVQVS